ncbi:hypothetical protein [Streptomyces chartreusis]|uniref:hypothetical protein n=1 Tax=Streptomyces chartreusis TaxID=1969 RepID=UPI00339DC6AF
MSDIVPVHRRTATGDAWFLYNNSAHPIEGTVTFTTTGAPSAVDLWTGAVTPLGEYKADAKTVSLPVRIEAEDTTAFLFDRRSAKTMSVVDTNADQVLRVGKSLVAQDEQGGTRTFTLSDGTKRTVTLPDLPGPAVLYGGWELSATTTAPTGTSKTALTLDSLKDWKDIPELNGKSGAGVYTKSVDLPVSWKGINRGVTLKLGEFAGAVRVWVNGKAVPVSEVPGTNAVDVTDQLRIGANTVKVELSTTLNNAMRTTAKAGTPGYSSFASRPELPTGLLGPVELVPYGRATVTTVK